MEKWKIEGKSADFALGPYIKDVRKIFGILDPSPPFVAHSRNLSVVFVTYWETPLLPSVRTSFKYRPLVIFTSKLDIGCGPKYRALPELNL